MNEHEHDRARALAEGLARGIAGDCDGGQMPPGATPRPRYATSSELWQLKEHGGGVVLLGLGGVAYSGKDAVANHLVLKHGWAKTYMSKALEKALLTLDPWIEENRRFSTLHGWVGYDESKKHPEVRRLLQLLGTEVGRNIDQDMWVRLAFEEVDTFMQLGASAVVTGIRYPNELKAIHSRGGIAIWVDRGLDPVNAHSSDNILTRSDFDDVIGNDGTLDDLHRCVDGWLKDTS